MVSRIVFPPVKIISTVGHMTRREGAQNGGVSHDSDLLPFPPSCTGIYILFCNVFLYRLCPDLSLSQTLFFFCCFSPHIKVGLILFSLGEKKIMLLMDRHSLTPPVHIFPPNVQFGWKEFKKIMPRKTLKFCPDMFLYIVCRPPTVIFDHQVSADLSLEF